jgi:hypothetical protein
MDIGAVCNRCAAARTQGALGQSIAEAIIRYPAHDLQVVGGRLKNDVDRLPSPYREAIRPYFVEQIFGAHHELLCMLRAERFGGMTTPIADPDLCTRYWMMIPKGCLEWNDAPARHAQFYTPRHRLFYYLLAGFSMFVLDRPGHPVGTPFPGGFRVERQRGRYLCPIRDRETDLWYSICNFCPAEQMDGV